MWNNPAKRRKKHSLWTIVIALFLIVWGLAIFVPFWNAIVISFMSKAQYNVHTAALIPYGFNIGNYEHLINAGGLLNSYLNTLMIVLCGTAYGLLITTMLAFGFSREFPGRKFLFGMMLFTMFFGGGMLPTYLNLKNLGLLGHRTAIILMLALSPFNVIIMKNSFDNSPREMEDAAKMDGANDLVIFARVLLPLQTPMLAAIGLFTAVGYWNEWFWSGLVINKMELLPISVFLRNAVSSATTQMNFGGVSFSSPENQKNVFSLGISMATLVFTMLPVMCVYPFLQKYFAKGVLTGAVKM